jgi:hypothetical protein
MNTVPATMPTHAATVFSLPRRRPLSTSCVSTTAGVSVVGWVVVGWAVDVVSGAVSMGLVFGSDEGVSLMFPMMATLLMRQS